MTKDIERAQDWMNRDPKTWGYKIYGPAHPMVVSVAKLLKEVRYEVVRDTVK